MDIEVVPAYKALSEVPEPLYSHWLNRYDAKRPKAEEDLSSEEYFLQESGIHALYSRVVCIGIGFFHKSSDYEWREIILSNLDERKLLSDFIEKWKKFSEYANKMVLQPYNSNSIPIFGVCGHNISEFDLPFLGRRLVMQGFSEELPNFWREAQHAKSWQLRNPTVIDTMHLWSFTGGQNRYISLELLAFALGFQFSKSLDYVEVRNAFRQWEEGDESAFKEVEEYCLSDVRITAAIFLALQGKRDLIPKIPKIT